AGCLPCRRRRTLTRGLSELVWGRAPAVLRSAATSARDNFLDTSRDRAGQQPLEVGVPDLAEEGVVLLYRHVDRGLVDERIDVVQGPLAVAAKDQALFQLVIALPHLEEVGGLAVKRAQDLQLHLEL